MQTSDWIAACAALISAAAAFYAAQSGAEARNANRIAVYNSLRSSRLAVYQAMDRFCEYCASYITLIHIGGATGARDLVERIKAFETEIFNYGPLGMEDVLVKCKDMQKRAWRMQRLIDRIASGDQTPHDVGYETGGENLEALVDWFAAERRQLGVLFAPYLEAPAPD